MKLENFTAVAELIKEREYIVKLRGYAAHEGAGLRILAATNHNLDVRSDLVAKLRPEMDLIFAQQIAIIEEKLAALGVTTASQVEV
jgi:ADP-heptose:LPS heptosyltransferase